MDRERGQCPRSWTAGGAGNAAERAAGAEPPGRAAGAGRADRPAGGELAAEPLLGRPI